MKEFKAKMTWAADGTEFIATVKVNSRGWGEVFDENGTYCGSLTPIQVIIKRQAA